VRAGHWQFFRFLAGGVANTTLTYALFVTLGLLMPPLAAYTISYVAGIGLSYLINTLFVFRTRASLRSALQFPGVYLVQYCLGLAILALLTRLGIDSRLAMVVVIAVNIPVTFVLTRYVLQGTTRGSTSKWQ